MFHKYSFAIKDFGDQSMFFISVAITWTNANENQYATKGKDFKIMCEVTAEPAPSVDWFKEGNPVSKTKTNISLLNFKQNVNVTNDEKLFRL